MDAMQIMDKALYVREMFASIAPRYDVVNRLLTGGIDEQWRKRAVRELGLGPKSSVIDLCCGTGDLSFHLLKRDPSTRVAGVDFCAPMLNNARRRALAISGSEQIDFREADVLSLPYEDDTFDGAIMGFSMRNVVDLDGCLREARRVIRPGRRFVNLDVSKAPNPLYRQLFNAYFYGLVPFVGGVFGGSKAAYRYLPSSLTNFPDADTLAERFRDAGFIEVRYIRLAGGAISIHMGAAP
jgi:demethylmenaquinone methyltransferase/2-methoxy-6-polyprenyl-1,4-benzoquinol methylase